MNTSRISELLDPFVRSLSSVQLEQTSMYIDLLLRWNARINLTAIRDPEEIVTRHFGESFFLARHLFPKAESSTQSDRSKLKAHSSQLTLNRGPERPRSLGGGTVERARVVDLGSGAGFPGLPIRIWQPEIYLTLIESNHKKAAFLREVVRELTLMDVDVVAERAEAVVDRIVQSPAQDRCVPTADRAKISAQSPSTRSPRQDRMAPADVVTFRAVEHFAQTLHLAFRFLAPHGRLAILIGSAQLPHLPHPDRSTSQLPSRNFRLPDYDSAEPLEWRTFHVPKSQKRLLALLD